MVKRISKRKDPLWLILQYFRMSHVSRIGEQLEEAIILDTSLCVASSLLGGNLKWRWQGACSPSGTPSDDLNHSGNKMPSRRVRAPCRGGWKVPAGIDYLPSGLPAQQIGRRYRCGEIDSITDAQVLMRQGHSYLVGNGDGEAC